MLLRQQDNYDGWPLESIVPDRAAFISFLQERWPIFIDRLVGQTKADFKQNELSCSFQVPGPSDLPFEHDDIRVYIDNMFIEGILEAIPYEQIDQLTSSWVTIGLRTDNATILSRRMKALIDGLTQGIPKEDARHEEWLQFAKSWAELNCLILDPENTIQDADRKKINVLQSEVDSAFISWLEMRYASLVNLPPVPPVMLHHVPRYIARHIGDDKQHKAVFILVDGLSQDQWTVVRKELVKQRANYRFRESSVFAWVPTITSVSRQAAFAGKPPIYFPTSIHTTSKEPILWTQFWADHGLTQHAVAYVKGLGSGTLDKLEQILAHPRVRVIGLVVDKVDKIMHGMELGAPGMHNQIRQWASQPFMVEMIDILLDHGFRIYLSSDHGNIEAVGFGRPAEGAVADLRGERVRIYPDATLRTKVKDRFPMALEWTPLGLPESYLPILAPSRYAFVQENGRLVGHGGASLEEVIVPLVQIERIEK